MPPGTTACPMETSKTLLRRENQVTKGPQSSCGSHCSMKTGLIRLDVSESKESQVPSNKVSLSATPSSSRTAISVYENIMSYEKSRQEEDSDKKRLSAVAAYDVIVETSLASHLSSNVQFGTKHTPSVVFSVYNTSSGDKCWSFVKSYGQLRSFDMSLRKDLAPLIKMGKYCLYHLPPKEMFMSLEPWKVDVRNDMLNTYFSVISDLKLHVSYNNDTEIQQKVDQTMAALWLHDILDKQSPSLSSSAKYDDSAGLPNMEGCLLTNNYRGEWLSKFCFTNGAYMIIIEENKGKPTCKPIFLMGAMVRAIVVFFDTTEADARYLFEVQETNGDSHYFTAENNEIRERWLTRLELRIAAIQNGKLDTKYKSANLKEIIPPYIVCGTSPIGLNTSHTQNQNCLQTVNPHALMSRSSSQNSIKSTGSSGISRYSLYNELNNENFPSGGNIYDGDEFYMQISNAATKDIYMMEYQSKPLPVPKQSHTNVHPHWQSRPLKYSSKFPGGSPPTNSNSSPSKLTISNPQKVEKLNSKECGKSSTSRLLTSTQQSVFGVAPQNCNHLIHVFKGVEVPSIIARCFQCIIQPESIIEKGIFRISGSVKLIHDLQEKFDTLGDLDLVKTHVDVHTSADLMKRYLRMLPRSYFGDWSESVSKRIFNLEGSERIEFIRSRIMKQDKMCRNIMFTVLRLLSCIVKHRDKNSMCIKNLGVALSPAMEISGPVLEQLIMHEVELFS